MMAMYVPVKGMSTFFLLCCTLLGSKTSAGTTTRRFIGLPETGQRIHYSNATENSRTVIVRHNLQGRIIFHESNEFWIEVLATTPEGQNSSNVKTLYTSLDNNTILLQVYQPNLALPDKASETDKVLIIILSSVGAFAFLGLVVSALCYFCYWKKRQETAGKQATKEICEGNTTPESRRRVAFGSQGGARPGTSGATQLAVVAVCACALHAQLQAVNVGINVYFPRGFIRPDSKVFLNQENNNKVTLITNDTKLQINVFDVANAGLISENRCSGRNLTCVNGACDPMVGKCVCPRKMRADRQPGGQTRCVYKCNEKCPKGSFELFPCNHTHPVVCKKCRPLCSFKEFESVPCAGKTDRNCTDISKLPRIKTSPNIVHEDVLKVKDDPPARKTISSLSRRSSTWLNRSSGLAIQINLLRVDFSTTFKEVKHDINDNKRLPNNAWSRDIVRNYCSSPVPDYYKIILQSEGQVKYVKGEPDRLCPSYDGSSRSLPAPGNSLTCNGAENPVVSLFRVHSAPEDFSKEDHSRQCYDYKQNCNKCRETCTKLARENPICNLTENDVKLDKRQDYGEHFAYCFDCCFQENCTCSNCACSLYNTSCIGSQLTCVEAERFAIPIHPVFPSSGNFTCHVELSQGPVFELEASVWKDGKKIRRIERSNRNYSQEGDTDDNSYDYGYMVLKHPFVLRNDVTKTIMIRGRAGISKLDVGWYKTEKELEPSSATRNLSIQPKDPFEINSRIWPGENCQTFNTERFVPISSRGAISNFKTFSTLSAQVAYEQSNRVYKVYNNSGLQQVHVEIPQGRSVLQYAFPGTVIFNDRSFTGQLLKNRTFWTIRLTGRVSSCPGFLVVRLTDQDRPDVDVYHFDIAITNQDCSFTIEFHLPSGGDTNMIDKQFVVRLTDSRKTMKLILVSPRRIPEFEIPDFDDDFDLKRLEILIPFGGASGGMLIVLIVILIYGYKTRPKDTYHRDRDNELHFRHLLFVVWFVGMRLVKSFLLTLTLLFVILTAIHYTNVKTLQEYETFHKQQKQVEEDFIKQMDAHKVQEINRQWELLQEGKMICDNKLKALNEFLKKHFKEMKERQEEEMRRKRILLAAINRIEKQFNATRAKFEIERRRLNEEMRGYSEEINSRLSQIQRKIESSFWLKVAKVLHKVLKIIASIFGKSIKPFIEWVGLKVNFPSINVEMPSFNDIFDDFKMSLSSLNPSDSSSNSSFWQENIPTDTKINIQRISVPELNISSPLNKERAEELLALEWIVQLYHSGVFTTILILLDILWFVYRHSRTYQLAIVLIHGFPKIYDLEKIQKKEEKKEEKKKKKVERQVERGSEEGDSFDSSAVESEDLQDKKGEDVQSKVKKKEEKKKKELKLKKKAEKKPMKKKDESLGSKPDEDQNEIKEERGKKASEDPEEPTNNKETARSTGKDKGQTGKNEDFLKIENTNDEEMISEEPKRKKVISRGLKGLDTLNTAFVKFLVKLKQLNYQINNTNLVPMCVLTVIAILTVYVVIVAAKHTMNVDTLDVIGYFDLKMAPLLTMRKIVNTRITSNAFMVNEVHIPYYENRVNARIAFHRKNAEMFQAYQCAKADLHNEEYCSWAEEPGASCEGVGPYNQDFLSNLTQFECNLEPVFPQRFTKFDRFRYKQVHKKAIAPYVAALRGLILDTFYMILIVIGIFIVLKILGLAVFVLLKRFDLVRQVKHYQVNRDLKNAMTLPNCIKYPSKETIGREIRPIELSESMKAKFGPQVNEGKRIVWK